MNQGTSTRVAVVGGARTPFAKAATRFKSYSALDLAMHSIDGLLEKHKIDPASIEELVYGIVTVNPRIPHLAREAVLRGTLRDETRALTVTDNCITGLSAIKIVHDEIVAGRAEVGIAGGVESMSNPAVQFNARASRILLDAAAARSMSARLKQLFKLRPRDFWPAPYAVAEPSTGLTMGEHVELMVKEWGVDRVEQDTVAYRSHMNAHAATEDGRLTAEIHPLDGVDRDLTIRPTTTMAQLAKLPPVFDRSAAGSLTAGNSSPLTDGAASVLLMSEARARKEGYEPLAYLAAFEVAALDPRDGLLMGPGLTVPRLLRRTGLTLADLDIIEMHEAFGGQIVCNLRAWEQGWKEPAIGAVDKEKLNPLGSSIAVGHPFAATGIRIVTTLANEMKRREAKYGLVSICGAGATAAAMLLERV